MEGRSQLPAVYRETHELLSRPRLQDTPFNKKRRDSANADPGIDAAVADLRIRESDDGAGSLVETVQQDHALAYGHSPRYDCGHRGSPARPARIYVPHFRIGVFMSAMETKDT